MSGFCQCDGDIGPNGLCSQCGKEVVFEPRSRPGLVGRNHPKTSYEAAASFTPVHVDAYSRVLIDYAKQGEFGTTDEEQQIRLSMNPSTQRPRRHDLIEDGFVVATENTRKTKADRNAIVFTITDKGVKAAAGLDRRKG